MLLDEVSEGVLVDAAEEIQDRVADAHVRGTMLDEGDRAAQAMRQARAEQAGQVEARVDDVEAGIALEKGVTLLEQALGRQAIDAQPVLVLETRQGLVVQGRDDEDVVAEKTQLLAQAVLVAFDAAQVGQEELHEDRDLDGTVSTVSH